MSVNTITSLWSCLSSKVKYNMTSVYINYPTSHFSVRTNERSAGRFRRDTPNRRFFEINISTFSGVMASFASGDVQFTAKSGFDDIWIDVDFDSPEFEEAVIRYVQEILGRRYKPLRDAEWRR